MKALWLLIGVAACTDRQNLGDHYSLRAPSWSIAAGGAVGYANATHVVIDRAGDVVAGGALCGTVDFGNTTLSPGLEATMWWVSKRSTIDGAEQWTLPFGGIGVEVRDLAVDDERDVFVLGSYNGSITLDGHQVSSVASDAFLAKYSPDGHIMWLAGLDGHDDIHGYSLAVDATGRAVVMAESTDGNHAVLAAYAADGTLRWKRTEPAAGHVHQTAADEIIVTGIIGASTTFEGTQIDLTRDPDQFAARFDVDGGLEWLHTFGDLGVVHQEAYSAVDENDRIATTANEPQLQTSVPTEVGLDGSGDVVWSASAAAAGIRELAIAASGGVVVTGGSVIGQRFDLGDGPHVAAMYLAARDARGQLLDVRGFGDPSLGHGDAITALAFGPSGELAFAGYVDQTIDFGGGAVVSPPPTHQGSLLIGVLAPP